MVAVGVVVGFAIGVGVGVGVGVGFGFAVGVDLTLFSRGVLAASLSFSSSLRRSATARLKTTMRSPFTLVWRIIDRTHWSSS